MLVKNELSGIPLLPVPACDDECAHLICAVQIVERPKSGKVLVADYFSPEEPYSLYARFFSDGNTWLTVREWPAQSWTKQQPVSLCISWQFGAGYVWSPEDDAELALSFLPVSDYFHRPMAAHNAGYVIESFIDHRRQEAKDRSAENRKHTQAEHFAMFPKLPDDLPGFLDERVFPGAYIFISTPKNGTRTARCSHCGEVFEVPAAVKHRQTTSCPGCGRYSTFIGDWYCPLNLVDTDVVVINHKVGGDLLIRWAQCIRTMSAPDFTPQYKFQDLGYNLHLHEKGREKLYCYLYKTLPYCDEPSWVRRSMGEPVCMMAHVYSRNLTEVFGRSHYNVDLADAFSGPSRPVLWRRILNRLRSDPTAEYLLKLRMTALVGYVEKPKAGTPIRAASLLQVDPNMLPLCREFNVTSSELSLLRRYGRPVSRQDFQKLLRFKSADVELLLKVLKRMTFTKLVNYFPSQPGRRAVNTLMQEWLDYIGMAADLGVDLTRKSVRYPKDIHEAHQRLLGAFNAKKAAEEEAANAAAVEALREKLPFLEFAHRSFIARIPLTRAELVAEGNSLNHCVGTFKRYWQNHVAAKELIVFVRKVTAPDKPYVTMQLNMEDFSICQIHGFGDRDPTAPEKAFFKLFAKQLKAAMTAGKEAAA